jgi:hypothetical protein
LPIFLLVLNGAPLCKSLKQIQKIQNINEPKL